MVPGPADDGGTARSSVFRRLASEEVNEPHAALFLHASCGYCGNRKHSRSFPWPNTMEDYMGRGILLWLLGIPIPIILLILLFWH